MTYSDSLEACSKFSSSRLYAQLIGLFLAIFYVIVAVCLFGFAWIFVREPETGEIILDARWIGSWIFFSSLILLCYALATLAIMVAALHRYRTCRADHRLFSIGSYMLLPAFPLGTIFCIYAIWKLGTERNSSDQTVDNISDEAL